MDIYDVIDSDHNLTHMLLERTGSARDPEWRRQLCHDLVQVVHVHAKAKQIAFYDVLQRSPSFLPLIEHVRTGQDIAESFLREALGLDPVSPQFMRLFHEAKAELTYIMQCEVDGLIVSARNFLTPQQAIQIGQRMRGLKDELIEADHMGSASLRADAGFYS